MDYAMFLNITHVLLILWLLAISWAMNVKDFSGAVLYKFIPFAAGLILAFDMLYKMGFIYRI